MQVPTNVGENYSEGINALFIEASALTPQNVDEIFFKIGKCFCNHAMHVNHS